MALLDLRTNANNHIIINILYHQATASFRVVLSNLTSLIDGFVLTCLSSGRKVPKHAHRLFPFDMSRVNGQLQQFYHIVDSNHFTLLFFFFGKA